MLKLKVGPVYTKVMYWDDREELEKLSTLLMIQMPNYFWSQKYKSGQWDGYIRFFHWGRKSFPTGFLSRVEQAFRKGIEYVDNMESVPTLSVEVDPDVFEGVTLRPNQVAGIERALEMGRGVMECAVNSGKTEMMLVLAKIIHEQTGQRTLFLYHRKDLLSQTVERAQQRCSDLNISCVWSEEVDTSGDIVLAMVQTLLSHKKKKSEVYDYVRKNFGVLILDESHRYTSRTWFEIAMEIQAPWRFAFSGTPYSKTDGLRNMKLEAVTAEQIYKISSGQLIDLGVSAKPIIYMVSGFASNSGSDLRYQQEYEQFVVYGEARNRTIVSVTADIFPDKKVLVLVTRIDHGKILQELLEEHGESVEFLHGSKTIEERTDAKNNFQWGDARILISSTIFDEGIDIPSLEVLVLAGAGFSDTRTIQRVGRGMRMSEGKDEVVVIDFIDSSKYLAKHARRRKSTFVGEGFKVTEVPFRKLASLQQESKVNETK